MEPAKVIDMLVRRAAAWLATVKRPSSTVRTLKMTPVQVLGQYEAQELRPNED